MKLSHFFHKLLIFLAVFALPLVTHAQTIELLLIRAGFWVNRATPILAGLALLVFFWGMVKFIFNAGDEEKRKQGKMVMGWGIIALFVVVSIWGIVRFISYSVGTRVGGSLPSPCLEGLPGCTQRGGILPF